MDSENNTIQKDNDALNENDMPTIEVPIVVNVLSKELIVVETSMCDIDATACTQDISSEKCHLDLSSKVHNDGTDIIINEKRDGKSDEKFGNESGCNSDRVPSRLLGVVSSTPEQHVCEDRFSRCDDATGVIMKDTQDSKPMEITGTEIVSNLDRDDSTLLGVVLSTPEQHVSEDNHAIKLNEVSSSFNLDSTEPLDVGTHASIPVFSTSQISLASTDTRTDHQIFLDHYYDSDETVLTNTTHSETPGEEDRKYHWDKKLFSSHVEFMMYMEAWGSFLVLHPFLF